MQSSVAFAYSIVRKYSLCFEALKSPLCPNSFNEFYLLSFIAYSWYAIHTDLFNARILNFGGSRLAAE